MSSWFNSASSWTKGNCHYIFPHMVIWFWENSDVVNGKIVSKCQLTHFRTKHQRDALWAVHHYLTQRCFLFLIQSIRTKYKLFLKWLKSVATPPPSIPQNNIFIIFALHFKLLLHDPQCFVWRWNENNSLIKIPTIGVYSNGRRLILRNKLALSCTL